MARVARTAPRAPGAGWKWWHGMLGGMLLMVSPGAALLLAALAAPVLLVLVADTTPRRALSRTVTLFCIAGAVDPLRAFLSMSHDLDAAMQLLIRPATILLAWAAAGCGWLLDETCNLSATLLTRMKLAGRVKALETELLTVRAEWELGPD